VVLAVVEPCPAAAQAARIPDRTRLNQQDRHQQGDADSPSQPSMPSSRPRRTHRGGWTCRGSVASADMAFHQRDRCGRDGSSGAGRRPPDGAGTAVRPTVPIRLPPR
jgi:hypothetical protein